MIDAADGLSPPGRRAGMPPHCGGGIDDDRVKAVNAGVVYGSITGFGQEGPYRDHPATDLVIQAFSRNAA